MAVAKSLDYNQSYIPEFKSYQENGQDSSGLIPLARSFVDGPISFETPSDTVVDLYRSYFENGSLTQAHYLPGLNNAKFPSFMINTYTEMNYESLEEWAAHVVDSWNLSELNASISTNRFRQAQDSLASWSLGNILALWVLTHLIILSPLIYPQTRETRALQNQYTDDSHWLRWSSKGVTHSKTK